MEKIKFSIGTKEPRFRPPYETDPVKYATAAYEELQRQIAATKNPRRKKILEARLEKHIDTVAIAIAGGIGG